MRKAHCKLRRVRTFDSTITHCEGATVPFLQWIMYKAFCKAECVVNRKLINMIGVPEAPNNSISTLLLPGNRPGVRLGEVLRSRGISFLTKNWKSEIGNSDQKRFLLIIPKLHFLWRVKKQPFLSGYKRLRQSPASFMTLKNWYICVDLEWIEPIPNNSSGTKLLWEKNESNFTSVFWNLMGGAGTCHCTLMRHCVSQIIFAYTQGNWLRTQSFSVGKCLEQPHLPWAW